MIEMELETKVLPEPLFRLIQTEKVKVSKMGSEIRLTPVVARKHDCPLLGMYSDNKLTVEKFLEWKKEDKELE